MRKIPKQFVGRWRITYTDQWDHDYYINLGVPAQITFRSDGRGQFQCGVIQGSIDGRSEMRNGKPAVEFSWEGGDEDKAASGRGWAALEDSDTLTGHLYIHEGNDSDFTAERSGKKSKQINRSLR